MSSQGWVKLYRSLLDDPVWLLSTPEQKVVLITLLTMANHSSKQWEWLGEKFEVLPGQFITSIDSIKSKAGKNISSQNVRTSLKRFEKLEFLTNKSTKTGRLITVVNWAFYQDENSDLTKQVTKTSQRANKDLTPNKNDKNEKKKDILSGKPDDVKNSRIDYANFFKWFNEQTGRSFKNVESNRRKVNGRLNDGYTKEDLAKVVTFMSKKWKGTDQEQYLRPETLFRPSKFEGYLNDAKQAERVNNSVSDTSKATDMNDLDKQQEENLRRAEEKYRKEHPELNE